MSLFKEILCSLSFNVRFNLRRKRHKKLVDDIHENGYSVVPGFLSEKRCSELRKKFDSIWSEDRTNKWRDALDSDNRIYFIEDLDSSFEEIFKDEFIRQVLYDYTGIRNPRGFLLGARLSEKSGNIGSGGGWHRDSPYRNQFKAVIYLSDVKQDNGPFSYINSTHRLFGYMKAYLTNVLRPGNYRFQNITVERFLKISRKNPIELTGDAGTLIFADTKGIHRGKPISTGYRYALFCYFWGQDIPAHFDKLKQKSYCDHK